MINLKNEWENLRLNCGYNKKFIGDIHPGSRCRDVSNVHGQGPCDVWCCLKFKDRILNKLKKI